MSGPYPYPLLDHVVEIGAGDRASSEALSGDIPQLARRITLYEPNRILYKDLIKAVPAGTEMPHPTLCGGFPSRITAHCAALSNATGEGDLYYLGYASYLDSAPSFLAQSIEPEGVPFLRPLMNPVKVRDTEVWDDGTWTYLILTNNGCELDVLTSMVSRPLVIRTKHYCHNARHLEHASRVCSWLNGNGYRGRTLETNRHSTFFHLHWDRV